MSDIVIQAENLGKKYTIGHQTERGRYLALRDVNAKAQSFPYSPFSTLHSLFSILPSPPEEVWALKDVRFEIRRGKFAPNYGIIEMMIGIGSGAKGYTVNEIRLQ